MLNHSLYVLVEFGLVVVVEVSLYLLKLTTAVWDLSHSFLVKYFFYFSIYFLQC